jgi:hypothetical protein
MTWQEWKKRIEALGIGDDTDIVAFDVDEDNAQSGEMTKTDDGRVVGL